MFPLGKITKTKQTKYLKHNTTKKGGTKRGRVEKYTDMLQIEEQIP